MTSSEADGSSRTWAGLREFANASGGGAEPHGGGDAGFAFSADQLRSIAGKWDKQAERYREMRYKAQRLRDTEGPGAEYASRDNAMKIRQSGEALEKALEQRFEYCRAQAEKFRAALGEYEATEDNVADVIKSAWGGEGDQSGGKW